MRRFNLVALAIFIAGLVWVFTFNTAATRRIQSTVMSWFAPFTRSGAKVQETVAGGSGDKRTAAELRTENEQLKRENDELHIYRDEYSKVLKEKNQLAKDLGFKQQNAFDLKYAKILVRKTSAWYRGATLDKGEAEGVQLYSPVLVKEGLVGRIIRVAEHESDILFLTDEQCKVAAEIEGSPVRGILEGVRVSTAKRPDLLLRIPGKDFEVQPGRQVYTSARSSSFPANILLGKIESFRLGDTSTEVIVKPAVDFDKLDFVFIMGLSGQPAAAAPLAPSTPQPSQPR
jgi:rod shape-determining protein MreC